MPDHTQCVGAQQTVGKLWSVRTDHDMIAIALATVTELGNNITAVIAAIRVPRTIVCRTGGFRVPSVVIVDSTNMPESAGSPGRINIRTTANVFRI